MGNAPAPLPCSLSFLFHSNNQEEFFWYDCPFIPLYHHLEIRSFLPSGKPIHRLSLWLSESVFPGTLNFTLTEVGFNVSFHFLNCRFIRFTFFFLFLFLEGGPDGWSKQNFDYLYPPSLPPRFKNFAKSSSWPPHLAAAHPQPLFTWLPHLWQWHHWSLRFKVLIPN